MIRTLARLLLASPFILLGFDAARQPGKRVDMAAELGIPSPRTAVRLNGWTMVGAGTALATGILPRLAALVLAGSLVPTTLAGHPYWRESDPQARAQGRIHFLKNLSMMGGLLYIARSKGE